MEQHSLRPKDVLDLAAPSTWAASVMPCVLAIGLSYKQQGSLRPLEALCLFVGAILMQSAVNALNDYADFVKGTDTLENSPDASDAVIVYGLAPKVARNCGIAFLALALMGPGLGAAFLAGPVPLLIGLVGAVVVVFYSHGKTPISYLPLGELVSGFVMGGLITLAGVYLQTHKLSLFVLVQALPVIIGIGLIMLSNNGCDLERDLVAGRHTLPCVMGRRRTDLLYRVAIVTWIACPLVLMLLQGMRMGAVVYALELPVMLQGVMRQLSLKLGQPARMQIMAGIGQLVVINSFAYVVALVVG